MNRAAHVNLHQTRIERPGAHTQGRQRGSVRVERAVRPKEHQELLTLPPVETADQDQELTEQVVPPTVMDLKTAVKNLRRHRRHTGMQKAAARVIRVELRQEQNRRSMAKSDLLIDLQAAMRGHRQDLEVQEEAIGAIGNLCFDNGDMRALAGRLTLLGDIQQAMEQFRGRASLQEWGTGAVRNICSSNTDNKARAGRCGLLEDLYLTMQRFSWHMGIMHNSLGAVRCLVSNEDNMIVAGKLGMLPCLQSAIRSYRAHVGIQMQAVGALRAMGGTADNSNEAGTLGMLLDLKGMLFDYAWHEVIVDLVAGAVWTLCAVNTRNKAEAGRLGLMADLQAVMQQNPDNKDIQLSTSMASVTLCFNSPANTAEAKRIGLMQDIQVTLQHHTGRAGMTHMRHDDPQVLLNLADEKPLMVLPTSETEQIMMLEGASEGNSSSPTASGSPATGRRSSRSPIRGMSSSGPPTPLLAPRGSSRGQHVQ